MEEGVLWRTDVMEGPCAVARGKDINNRARKNWELINNTHT
jgi:hypothetical protein